MKQRLLPLKVHKYLKKIDGWKKNPDQIGLDEEKMTNFSFIYCPESNLEEKTPKEYYFNWEKHKNYFDYVAPMLYYGAESYGHGRTTDDLKQQGQGILNQFILNMSEIGKDFNSGGAYIKKNKKVKIENSIKKMLKEEENFGIKKYETYKNFGNKVHMIRENVIKNLRQLRKKNKLIIGYGAPAKATTALNFFGINDEIDFIVEDNKLKHNKFIPGVQIPIKNKSKIQNKNNTLIVLAWNFYDDIKKNNSNLSDNFVNIKELETNS